MKFNEACKLKEVSPVTTEKYFRELDTSKKGVFVKHFKRWFCQGADFNDIENASENIEFYEKYRNRFPHPRNLTCKEFALLNIHQDMGDEVRVIHDGEWMIVQPYTFRAAKYYSKGTNWCTRKKETNFHDYERLLICIRGDEKFQTDCCDEHNNAQNDPDDSFLPQIAPYLNVWEFPFIADYRKNLSRAEKLHCYHKGVLKLSNLDEEDRFSIMVKQPWLARNESPEMLARIVKKNPEAIQYFDYPMKSAINTFRSRKAFRDLSRIPDHDAISNPCSEVVLSQLQRNIEEINETHRSEWLNTSYYDRLSTFYQLHLRN